MKSFFFLSWQPILRGALIAGTLVILLSIALERADYIQYKFLGLMVVGVMTVLACILVLAGKSTYVDNKDMVQFSDMAPDEANNAPQPEAKKEDSILSPVEAREWLDEFLVAQQKNTSK